MCLVTEATKAVGGRGARAGPGAPTPLGPPDGVSRTRQWAEEHRRALSMAARLSALGLVLWLFVVPQLRGASQWPALLRDIDASWVPLAIVAEVGSLVLYTLVTRSLLAPRTRPRYDRVARIDLSAIALGHCLPDGGAAGTALCWRLLVADGVPPTDAAFTKIAQGLGSALVLQILVLAALTGSILLGGVSTWAAGPILAASAILAVVALAALSLRSEALRARLHGLLSRVPRYGPRVRDIFDGLYRRDVIEHLRAVAADPTKLATAVAAAGGNWVLDAVALWAALHAFGPGVGLAGLAVVYSIQALAAWLPITPSGLGISESLMIPALIAFGAPRADAVLGIITWRLVAFWLPIPLGALAYATLGSRRQRST